VLPSWSKLRGECILIAFFLGLPESDDFAAFVLEGDEGGVVSILGATLCNTLRV
jgi:hypothetical protein